ncbi:hypothetical protein TrLO_g5095 [Triparma laevis f. longispina]|uniref:Uncharacterized protein n=1 Tax=Triparma laevis f. longispina TaxID=1714387 RepID=A0A9W7APN9_9STRA|nr:hypothetical protein TrLO_g5095 [Triparma laevis f. longispina]
MLPPPPLSTNLTSSKPSSQSSSKPATKPATKPKTSFLPPPPLSTHLPPPPLSTLTSIVKPVIKPSIKPTIPPPPKPTFKPETLSQPTSYKPVVEERFEGRNVQHAVNVDGIVKDEISVVDKVIDVDVKLDSKVDIKINAKLLPPTPTPSLPPLTQSLLTPPLQTFYINLSTHLLSPSPQSLLPCIQVLLKIIGMGRGEGIVEELIEDAKKKLEGAIRGVAEEAYKNNDTPTASLLLEYSSAFSFPSTYTSYILSTYKTQISPLLKTLSEERSNHINCLAEVLGDGSLFLERVFKWREAVEEGGGGEGRILEALNEVEESLEIEIGKVVKAISNWFWKDRLDRIVVDDLDNLAELDDVLNDLSFACNLLLRYNKFVKLQSEVTSKIYESLKECYINFEGRLLNSAINKIIKTSAVIELQDNVEGPSHPDDVYALSLKSLQRSSDSGCENEIKSIIKNVYKIGGNLWKALDENVGCYYNIKGGVKEEKEVKEKSSLGFFASALLEAVDEDIGGVGDVWRYSEEERLMGVLRRVVGVWVCWRGCGGLNLDEEGEVWKNRLSSEIESLVENNIGGEKFDEFESIEKNLPYRTLSNTFERIDFCVKDTTTFQKLDSDEIVEKFIIRPIKENNLISMIIKNNKLGEDEIALMVYSRIVKQFASLFYTTILEKKIGTWGAMLAQKYLRSVMGAVLGEWDVGEMRCREEFEKCSEAVFLIGLETVKDYAMYYKEQGRSAAVLGEDEVKRVLSLRKDFDERDL